MSAPILATKLYIPPPRPSIVRRPRLIERMNEGIQRKLTLISAPAGFGKSTLVSEWVAGCGRPAAWLSLDEGDNDPGRFLAYAIAALRTIAENIGGRALGLLDGPQPPAIESVLTSLLNELAAFPDHFILVLDDYHAIDSQPVDRALAFLIDHQPPQMHLLIATREDPQLPLARLRARGQLTELRGTELRFTFSESADFLNQVMGLDLSAEDVAALEARTEGWIAGLQLAALSMQGHQDTAGFIKSFTGSHHFVLDYLVEEVLGQLSKSIQTFLLRTSILERMCGPLCDAVLGDPAVPGQETLEQLEHANLFIVPLDDERHWYRYHHLFADLLRQRLRQNLSPTDITGLHIRAGEWYEQNGLKLEALQHALTAGEFGRAARLAEDVWQDMDRSFQTAAWLGRVKKLPGTVVSSRPGLCVQLGWAFSDLGDLEASEACLQDAERALSGALDRDEWKSLPATIALIRAGNAQIQGDLAETVKYAELCIRLTPGDDIYLRAQAAITLEFNHWATGNLEASLRGMRAWMEDMQRQGNQVFVVASAFALADMQVILGRLGEAETSLREGIQQAAAQGKDTESVTAHHHLGLALLAHERGDAAAAAQFLQTAADLGQRTTLVDWQYRWSLARARLKESAGQLDTALELLDEAQRGYVKNPIPMLQPVAAHRARIYLKQGRLDRAQAWVRERGISTEAELRYLDEYEHLTLARVRLAEGSFAGVDDLLERLSRLAETQKRTGCLIEILLTQALVYRAQSDRLEALAALERALRLAEPEGYLRTFVDEGEPMRLLLFDLRSTIEKQASGSLPGYVDKILAAFSPPAEVGSSSTIAGRESEIVEPLTGRELEILHLIAGGQSNAQIGRRLYLALSTVKGHNLRIFDKLQVRSRTEAVARARELGLL